MTPEGSVSFDRAAAFYDATRAIPPETLDAVCGALDAEVPDGRCLEIGVGTGRIAIPMASRGRVVVGVDISEQMLAKLREKDHRNIDVAAADATNLPFGDDAFAGAYAVHVLHLIADWKHAACELARVVRPGGKLVFDIGNADPNRPGAWVGIAREIELRFIAETGIERRHPGITDIGELDGLLAEYGAVARDLEPIRGFRPVAPSVIIDLIEHGVFSFTWSLDEDTRRRGAQAVRTWAADRFGDLAQPRDLESVIAFRAYALPA